MKNFFKNQFINFTAIFVLTAVLLVVPSGFSGCGIILGADSGDVESLTFASQNNYERNDILVDADNYANYTETSPPIVPQAINETESDETETSVDIPAPTTENTPPQPTQNKEETVRISFLAAGDNIMHLNMINDAQERAKDGEKFNFKDMYRDIADIVKAADISLVNVETPIAGDEFAYDGYPMFNTPKENGFALVDIGFDIITIANNHMLDKWEKGYMNHIEFWEKQPVLLIGGFKDQEDFENIRIYSKNGVSIAFLSYTYGTNGMFLPVGSKMVIPLIDAATIERQVKAARPLADLLFVVMHWGDEDRFEANLSQRSLAQTMVGFKPVFISPVHYDKQ